MKTLEERFWGKVEFIPFHSCWEWVGAKSSFGHGRLNRGIRGLNCVRAHRVSWELHHSSVPVGLCVLHRCDNPGCVNPLHLFLGTKQDNSRDMMAKNRGKGQVTKGSSLWRKRLEN